MKQINEKVFNGLIKLEKLCIYGSLDFEISDSNIFQNLTNLKDLEFQNFNLNRIDADLLKNLT